MTFLWLKALFFMLIRRFVGEVCFLRLGGNSPMMVPVQCEK